jgi:hypothetical protein
MDGEAGCDRNEGDWEYKKVTFYGLLMKKFDSLQSFNFNNHVLVRWAIVKG